jgi:hypothetical protein
MLGQRIKDVGLSDRDEVASVVGACGCAAVQRVLHQRSAV